MIIAPSAALSCSAVSCCYGRGATAALDSDALALNMGTYFQANLAHVLPHTAAPAVAASRAAASEVTVAAAADAGDAALAATALTLAAGSNSSSSNSSSGGGGGSGSGGRQDCACAELSLYSVCPRSLQARVKVWSSSLSFKEGTQQTSRGYFQAPGRIDCWQIGIASHAVTCCQQDVTYDKGSTDQQDAYPVLD